MFYQVKAIRKGTKPPIWRRILVPSNISYSQLAVVLEGILELPFLDTYMFESYSNKMRFSEYREGKKLPSDYYYTAYDAAENYINECFDTGKSISFNFPGKEDYLPGYRLEIEKCLGSVALSDRSTGEKVEVRSPLIVKETSGENDSYFSDPRSINEMMKENFFIVEGDSYFADHSEVYERVLKGKGILFSKDPKSRKNHVARSSQSYLMEIADNFELLLGQQSKADQGDYDKAISSGSAAKSIRKQSSGFGTSPRRHTSLEDFLAEDSYEELMEAAEDIHYHTTEKDRKKIAKALAKQYLLPNTMKQQLFWATEEELDDFEESVKKRDTFFKVSDWDRYGGIYGLGYYLAYSDDHIGVTGDIADTYEILVKSGYRTLHRQVRWLRDCLGYVGMFYAVIPIKQLYRIFKQKEGMDIGFDTFRNLCHDIPSDYSICSFSGDKAVERGLLERDLYKKLEKRMFDVGYYIPSVSNIEAYAKDHYPSDVPQYIKLFEYFNGKLGWKQKKATEMCIEAVREFSYGTDVPGYIEKLYDKGLSRTNYEDINNITMLVIDVYNNTRRFDFRGHTSGEVLDIKPNVIDEGIPIIDPNKTTIANVLNLPKAPFDMTGFNVDSGLNVLNGRTASAPASRDSKVIPMMKKVYPNAPCPCGSGKKYKKCCGKNV